MNWAQNEMNIQFHGFQDTRGVTVLSPSIDLTRDMSDRTGLRLKFGVDAVTAASDGCARCHLEGARSARGAFGASIVRKYGDAKLTLGGEYSQENFYRATTGLTSISRDFNQGNTTVAGGFSFSLNQPTLHPSEELKNQFATNVYVSATQTLTKSSIVQLGYELANINGYQADPFLRAHVNGALVVGNTPDVRTRHALSARLRQALPADTYLEVDYRRYHDTWAIDSNALSAGVSRHFSPQLLLGFSYRWYDQTGASFYQPEYTGSPIYYTADFRLVPFDSGLYSGRIVITPKHRFLSLPEGTGVTGSYERYRTSNGFDAAIFTVGLKIPY